MDYYAWPLWWLALLFLGGLLAARESGYWLRRRRIRTGRSVESKGDDGFSTSSVLGLLALLIGFTFSLSLQRYEQRRELVISEANALGTTWLRSQLLEDSARVRVQSLLRRYVETRIEFGRADSSNAELAAHHKGEALQQQIWQTMLEGIAPFRTTALAPLVVNTTNESFDLAATRLAAREARTPPRIMRILVLYALFSAAMIGFEKGRYRAATTVLFLLLTLAVVLILDLDRPASGAIQVSQQPMLDLQRSMAQ